MEHLAKYLAMRLAIEEEKSSQGIFIVTKTVYNFYHCVDFSRVPRTITIINELRIENFKISNDVFHTHAG